MSAIRIRLVALAGCVSSVSLAQPSPPPAAQPNPPTINESRALIDWYEEEGLKTETQARVVTERVLNAVTLDALPFSGEVRVPHIQYPASGWNQNCGDGKASDASYIGDVLKKSGGVVISASSAGGPGAGIVAAIGAGITAIGYALSPGGPHSDTSNCGLATVVLPGHYDEAKLPAIVKLRYEFADRDGEPYRGAQPNNDLGWSMLFGPTVSATEIKVNAGGDFAKAMLMKGEGNNWTKAPDSYKCPVTIVLVQLKNWSDNRDRRLRVSASIDKDMIPKGSCIDSSFINKDLYTDKYAAAIPIETRQKYLKWLADKLLKGIK